MLQYLGQLMSVLASWEIVHYLKTVISEDRASGQEEDAGTPEPEKSVFSRGKISAYTF
jgi:hypothetical protein